MLRAGKVPSEQTGKPVESKPWTLWVRLTSSGARGVVRTQGPRDQRPCWPPASAAAFCPPTRVQSPFQPFPFRQESQEENGHLLSPKGHARLRGYSGGGRRRPARPTTGRQGRGGGCEGRGGTGRPLWRRGRGSSLLGGIRLYSLGLRLTTSLPLLKTPRLQSWRRIPSASGSQPPRRGPNLSSSIRGSEGRACALAPRVAAPPRSGRESELPRPPPQRPC